MLPPPAPISISSMTVVLRGRPLPFLNRYTLATSKSGVVIGFPPSIRQALAVVPPMSKESRLGRPVRSP